MASPQAHATPEQVEALQAHLKTWEALLRDLEATLATSSPTSGTDPTRQELAMSRRILSNYRRTLARDLERGLQHLPAAEAARASETAEASIRRLRALGGA